MKIIFDIDGTLCFVIPPLREFIKRREIKEAPWQIVLVGLRVLKPKVDPEMIDISNRYLTSPAKIQAFSERPVRTEGYTERWLREEGFSFHSVRCLGTEKGKKDYILGEKPDIVVDDDEEILSFCKYERYKAYHPEKFKKIDHREVIKQI